VKILCLRDADKAMPGREALYRSMPSGSAANGRVLKADANFNKTAGKTASGVERHDNI